MATRVHPVREYESKSSLPPTHDGTVDDRLLQSHEGRTKSKLTKICHALLSHFFSR